MDFQNHTFRKYSSFLPNHASPDADLTLPPTYLQFNMGREIEDYLLQEWITAALTGSQSNNAAKGSVVRTEASIIHQLFFIPIQLE